MNTSLERYFRVGTRIHGIYDHTRTHHKLGGSKTCGKVDKMFARHINNIMLECQINLLALEECLLSMLG